MASRPCKAWVSGAEWHTLEITPIFVPGAYNALWGMHDVMAAFPAITFDSRAQKYTLEFPDPPEDV